LMQLVVFCILGPTAPKVHLAAPIIVHFNLIWRSASRLFTQDRFLKFTSIHELGKLQRNALLLMALSTSNAEKE
jgi:hypothetical protein